MPEIDIMMVIGFTVAAVVVGLLVGYLLFIRPKNRAVQKETEYAAQAPQPIQTAPMAELPTVYPDVMDEALKDRDGG